MKKCGKFEKRPAEAPEKQPKVKSVLLQTYFTSLLCMVLCVTMFFGTSYAWFTSEVQNTGNEIYIGTLDVGLFKQITTEEGTSSLVDLAKEGKLFDNSIRWEPGYTALETIQVVNEGDLAFKYVLNFTDGSLADGSTQSIENIAKYFDVWVYDYYANEDAVPTAESYSDIIAGGTTNGTKWEYAGSLDKLLEGETVLDGVMVTVREEDQEAAVINKGTDDGVATVDTYIIALHMKEETDSAVMGQKISLNVKLVAYQMVSTSETDGFGTPNYDSNVTVADNAKRLQTALSSGGNVQLITDVEISSEEDRVTMNGGVLYGNGKTITYGGDKNANGNSVGVLTTSGGTVSNLTIDGGENGRALYITKLTSDLYVTDCTFSGAYAFNLNSADTTEYTLNFTNTVFKSWTSYANVMKHAYFTNCTFNDVLKPYGDTTLTNCTFTTEGLDVSALKAGETITLINCTYNGCLIENVVLTATADENGQVTVKCDNALLNIKDGKVALNNSNN